MNTVAPLRDSRAAGSRIAVFNYDSTEGMVVNTRPKAAVLLGHKEEIRHTDREEETQM